MSINMIQFTNKARAALQLEMDRINAGENLTVTISHGNIKMGDVPSVSILPILTCPGICRGTCGPDCYAAKIANLRPSVLKSYAKNTAIMLLQPDKYWAAIKAAAIGSRFFRYHVSGDIYGIPYLDNMVKITRELPGTEFLAFTKCFNTVNKWIDSNGELPANLHILFSGWNNLKPVNPYGLPETNIFDENNPPRDNWLICGGNCFECFCRGVGCWQVKNGETIAFKKH